MLFVFLNSPMLTLCWLSSTSHRIYRLNFREIFGENSVRRKFRAKIPLGETSFRRKFRSAKIPFGENSAGRNFLRRKLLRRKFFRRKFLAPTSRSMSLLAVQFEFWMFCKQGVYNKSGIYIWDLPHVQKSFKLISAFLTLGPDTSLQQLIFEYQTTREKQYKMSRLGYYFSDTAYQDISHLQEPDEEYYHIQRMILQTIRK